VRYLYQQFYLPLLACHERQQRDRLAQVAKAQGGVLIALDGLAPQAGEPQRWCIRELLTGLTLRSGWLSQQDRLTFEAFLAPLKHLEWPILAVLSDKQTGLVPAVVAVLPNIRHQFCQAHLATGRPLAEAMRTKVALRQTVRQHLGVFLREPGTESAQRAPLTVTGLVPVARKAHGASLPKPNPSGHPHRASPNLRWSSRSCWPYPLPAHPQAGRPGWPASDERLQRVARFGLELLAQR
jgi:hypothetical protein